MQDYSSYKIGVLALQGAVTEHLQQIAQLGARGVAVKKTSQLSELDALILPGGESTAIGHLMRQCGFIEAIRDFSSQQKPILGTCAGMILLAKELAGAEQPHLQLMDIRVQRNAFGRQVESFQVDLKIKGLIDSFPAIFIRAPIIEKVNLSTEQKSEVEVLAEFNGNVVLAKQKNLVACSFHPELTDNTAVMRLFLDLIKKSN